jgi:hypothetical protein
MAVEWLTILCLTVSRVFEPLKYTLRPKMTCFTDLGAKDEHLPL